MSVHFYGFDLETAGEKQEYALQPYRLMREQCQITSFAVVDENGLNVANGLWPSVEQLRTPLEKLAEDPWAVVVGWNTVFDTSWLIAMGLEDVVRRINWMDGQILRRGLENTTYPSGWGLKPTVAKYLPEHAGYGDDAKASGYEVKQELLKYNIKDSLYTAQLARRMWDQIDARSATLVQVICQCIPAFARAWVHGVPMSRTALETWSKRCTQVMVDALNDSPFEAETIRSHAKLKAALNGNGFSVTNTNKKTLSLFANDPLVQPVIDYKRAAGSISRYITNAVKCMDYIGQDTVHPQPKMWGTYTGRCTYSATQKVPALNKKTGAPIVNKKTGKIQTREIQVGAPLHQWPKKREGKLARSCVVAPPGYLLAEFDFSNQESRVLADRTQDPTMLEVFNNGQDFHCIMGAKAVGKNYEDMLSWFQTGDKEAERIRQMGKVANLQLSYRAGSQTFQTIARTDYDVILTLDESVMMCSLYKQTYPGIVNYWKQAIQTAKQKGYAETLCGRRVYFDPADWDYRNNPKRAYASEQTSINFPIQGTGADMKFLGIALTDAYAHTRGAIYMLDLHDALFYCIPDDAQALTTAREIQRILNTLPYQEVFGWCPSVPMPVDAKIGPSWGDMRDIKEL